MVTKPVIASHHAQAGLANNHQAIVAELPKLRRIITHDTSAVDIARSEGLSSDGQKFYVQNIDQKARRGTLIYPASMKACKLSRTLLTASKLILSIVVR